MTWPIRHERTTSAPAEQVHELSFILAPSHRMRSGDVADYREAGKGDEGASKWPAEVAGVIGGVSNSGC